ncbi:hypothetical protein TIFTF001_007677 [Ficus carica]|uniref:Aminotransferase-like plant mobile domain-containing protein n=1 Tax=Ficus carica TaxID=3494 RepID=A0AA87ZLQ0_FICCA|nr:hypothetical protein TIFTF001_007677 [Ficus carica]
MVRVKTTTSFMPPVVTDMGFIKDNQFTTIIREICTDDIVGEIQAPEFLGAACTKCFIDRGDLSPVLIILKDSLGLRHVVRRWNKKTHIWHALGRIPALNNVAIVFQLPVIGQRSNFATWIKYFWGLIGNETCVPGKGVSWKCQTRALVACWLSRFIFPELPDDTIQNNEFLRASTFVVESYFPSSLFQFFLSDHFPDYASEPLSLEAVKKAMGTFYTLELKMPACCCWFHKKSPWCNLLPFPGTYVPFTIEP